MSHPPLPRNFISRSPSEIASHREQHPPIAVQAFRDNAVETLRFQRDLGHLCACGAASRPAHSYGPRQHEGGAAGAAHALFEQLRFLRVSPPSRAHVSFCAASLPNIRQEGGDWNLPIVALAGFFILVKLWTRDPRDGGTPRTFRPSIITAQRWTLLSYRWIWHQQCTLTLCCEC